MIKHFGKLSGVALAIALLASASIAQDKLQYKELPRIHKVSDTLYRGAQPAVGGLKILKDELGIKTIINLRGEDKQSRKEKEEANSLGLQYYSIPMAGIGRPADKQIAEVMKIIEAPENQPVFVHCKHGNDRTGTVVACYRIMREGWNANRAVTEANRHGMHRIMYGMRGYIADFYNQHNPTGEKARGGRLDKIGEAFASASYRGWNALKRAGAALGFVR